MHQEETEKNCPQLISIIFFLQFSKESSVENYLSVFFIRNTNVH